MKKLNNILFKFHLNNKTKLIHLKLTKEEKLFMILENILKKYVKYNII